jgi:hypothetical protein
MSTSRLSPETITSIWWFQTWKILFFLFCKWHNVRIIRQDIIQRKTRADLADQLRWRNQPLSPCTIQRGSEEANTNKDLSSQKRKVQKAYNCNLHGWAHKKGGVVLLGKLGNESDFDFTWRWRFAPHLDTRNTINATVAEPWQHY